jgi:hypothetical protein
MCKHVSFRIHLKDTVVIWDFCHIAQTPKYIYLQVLTLQHNWCAALLTYITEFVSVIPGFRGGWGGHFREIVAKKRGVSGTYCWPNFFFSKKIMFFDSILTCRSEKQYETVLKQPIWACLRHFQRLFAILDLFCVGFANFF